MFYVILNGENVTKYVYEIVWEGDMDAPARSLRVRLSGVGAAPGDRISLHYSGKKLFGGIVIENEAESEGRARITAYDYGIYLANNYTYRQYTGKPSEIARRICTEFSLRPGKLADINRSVKVTSTGELSAFRVIEKAYENALPSGNKEYLVRLSDTTLGIAAVGADCGAVLSGGVAGSSRTHSIAEMKNRVVILDTRGKKKLGEVSREADRKKFGTFQDVYRKEKGVNAQMGAQRLLIPQKQTAALKTVGDIRLLSGLSVAVRDGFLDGRYVIREDKHTVCADGYTTELELYI